MFCSFPLRASEGFHHHSPGATQPGVQESTASASVFWSQRIPSVLEGSLCSPGIFPRTLFPEAAGAQLWASLLVLSLTNLLNGKATGVLEGFSIYTWLCVWPSMALLSQYGEGLDCRGCTWSCHRLWKNVGRNPLPISSPILSQPYSLLLGYIYPRHGMYQKRDGHNSQGEGPGAKHVAMLPGKAGAGCFHPKDNKLCMSYFTR